MSTDYLPVCYTCKKYCPEEYRTKGFIEYAIENAQDMKKLLQDLDVVGKEISYGIPELWDFPHYFRFVALHAGHDLRTETEYVRLPEDFTKDEMDDWCRFFA